MKYFAPAGLGLAAVLAILFVPTPRAAAAPDVLLMIEGEDFQPSSTLEVRFARDMVSPEAAGLAGESPLLFDPPLPGSFTWLSRRSGVYTPAEMPRLGVSYQVSTRPDLADVSGSPIGAAYRSTLTTPPFGVSFLPGEDLKPDTCAANPEIRVAFNLAVSLESASGFLRFVDETGAVISANTRYATSQDYFSLPTGSEDWADRWRRAREPAPAVEDTGSAESSEPEPIRNRLIVRPEAPLTPERLWRFEIAAGVPDATGAYRSSQERVAHLGLVEPFVLTAITPASYIHTGRSITLGFSEPPGPDVDSETAPDFFRITPAVPNLRFEEGWESVVVRGDFDRETSYVLEIDPSLIAQSGLPVSGPLSHTFQLGPVKPRVYLPEITGHQIRAGRRKLEALAVNLQSLWVTARRVKPEAVTAMVAAFEDYEKGWDPDGDPNEYYQHLLPGLIGGEVIFDQTLPFPDPEIDAAQQLSLDWDEVLGPEAAGAIFLTVEGEPLPELGGRRPGAQALIQVTDLGVLWNSAGNRLEVSVFSMASGQPVPGVRATLRDKDHIVGGSAETGADGVAVLPAGDGDGWLDVRLGEDVHGLRIGPGHELPTWAFRAPVDYGRWGEDPSSNPPLKVLVFSDRPIYRPGETAYFKGIVRRQGETGIEPAAGLDGVLRVTLPNQRGVTELTVRTDEGGAFDTSIRLDRSVVGSYSALVDFPDENLSSWQPGVRTAFLAAEVLPNAFEVRIDGTPRYAPDAEVRAEVTGRYLFGGAISEARLRWTLQYVPTAFSPGGFEGFSFGEDSGYAQKTLLLHGDAELRDRVVIRPALPAPEIDPARGSLTVEVTDINQQTVAETHTFTRDAAGFYLGLAYPETGVIGHQEEIVARAVAVRPDGSPVTDRVDVNVELIRVRYRTVRVQGAGKAISFRTDTTEEVVSSAAGPAVQPLLRDGVWRVPEAETARFLPGKAGSYRLSATAQDSSGRLTKASIGFSVSGDEPVAWNYRNPAQIDLTPDKSIYRDGDTARILVKTPIAGPALLRVIRGDRVLRSERVALEGNAPLLEIPIAAEFAPNAVVSLILIRGAEQSTRKHPTAEYRYGICRVDVANPATQILVRLAPTAESVQPGDTVETEVLVQDETGSPVADAEVTFFAIDDGLVALTGYERPQPREIFHAPIPLKIRTGLSLYSLLPEDPADLDFGNKGYLIGGGGLDGPGPKLRRDFPGTACWFPALRTDAGGRTVVRFEAPDALTRYRLVAVVHAGGERFGSAESAVTIRQPLMLLSTLGQAANAGDRLLARAVLRNETGHDGSAEVSLELDATAEADEGALSTIVTVNNGASATVDFPVRLVAPGNAEWKWSARFRSGEAAFEDHITAPLRVGSPAPVLREIYLSDLAARQNDLLEGVNPQLLEGTGEVRVTLSNTRLASLREASQRLLNYPYGCAEQTISNFIPWTLLPTLGPVLPELGRSEEEIRDALVDGPAKILAFQTGSGGLAFWPQGVRDHLFPSAWAVVALTSLRDQGVPLPEGWTALLDYLSSELRGISDLGEGYNLENHALALYALAQAGQPEPGYHEVLFQRRQELSLESRALLALAILHAGGSKEMTADLLDARKSPAEVYSWFGGEARGLAIRLLAWTHHSPKAKEVERLTQELLQAQRNGAWRTTQENAWALLALSRYFTAVEGRLQPVEGVLAASGQDLPFNLTREQLTDTRTFSFQPAETLSSLLVRNPLRSKLYGETRFEVRARVELQPRQDRGYAVSRSYREIAADGSLEEASNLQVGDRVLVTLRIETSRPAHFVAIDDPLPAILEAIHPEFRTQAAGAGEDLDDPWVADHREIRADRVLYFCDHLPAGDFTFTYLARVRSAGDAVAPAAKVEEMYWPERFGLSETARLQSRAN